MPRPGDTVVDAGTGTGDDAVVFSRLVGPAGRVIAIEAHPSRQSSPQRRDGRAEVLRLREVE